MEQSRLSVLRHRIECDLRCGRHQQAADELTDLVGRHPGCETFRRQLTMARNGPVRSTHPDDPSWSASRLGRDPRGLSRVGR
ncbi:BTAD domain-containing putative transcriptional regulator [Micromonospora sp. NPDC049230]|uniref:BTAD domain-containing putative transcriptional regulator n=1 Tax=Micromonospora sp. NPDC049230 TaxID=3155502 RepID=UPI0033FBBFD0